MRLSSRTAVDLAKAKRFEYLGLLNSTGRHNDDGELGSRCAKVVGRSDHRPNGRENIPPI